MKKTRKIAKSAALIAPIADAEAAVRETGPAEKIPPMIPPAGHAEMNQPETNAAGLRADLKTSEAVTGDSSETWPENCATIWKIRATSTTRANAPGQTRQDQLSGSTAVTAAAGE